MYQSMKHYGFSYIGSGLQLGGRAPPPGILQVNSLSFYEGVGEREEGKGREGEEREGERDRDEKLGKPLHLPF